MSSQEKDWLIEYLDSLRRARFYGKIIIEIKEGSIVLLRKEETLKPPSGSESQKYSPSTHVRG